MCGIWAYILTKPACKVLKNNDYYNNHKLLYSRGPDDCNNYIEDSNFLIVFYRLSINDMSLDGRQPFIFKEKSATYYVMCNGEIYNYKKLKSEYNIKTKSLSDCEIIYHMFVKLDYDIYKLCNILNGEFAFVILKKEDDNISYWISRDPYGVRSLYYIKTDNAIIVSTLCKSLVNIDDNSKIKPILPGYYYTNTEITKYYYPLQYKIVISDVDLEITNRLIAAVSNRLLSDRPIGALLSGGLDSSLVIGILVKILKIKNLKTFSIGLTENSTDIINSRKVVNHFRNDIKHTEIIIPYTDALLVIEDVIKTIESYDITTVRASIMQYLISKYINVNTHVKVLFNGDGADEVQLGYLYYHYAPNSDETVKENRTLLNEISDYDVLRVDKCISNFSLEARVPYLDISFVDYYLSLPLEMKLPKDGLEKKLIRDAFYKLYPDILPYDILYRKKEAFSDGVSTTESSWFKILQNYINNIITDEEYEKEREKYIINMPETKEAYYYRKIFNKYYKNMDAIVPHFWLPKWINTNEPSARILSVY